jgi:hypothetical protein
MVRNGRHARRSGRAAGRQRVVALLGAGALALPLMVSTSVPNAAAADPCTTPQLTDFLVSQGPAEYSGLAAGKTSLVKLFLSTPSCLPVGARVQVSGAQLTVQGSSAPVVLQAALPLPTLSSSSSSPVPSTPSDVLFQVPGTAMRPATGSTLTFSAVVDYVVTGGGQTVRDRVVLATAPGTSNPLSATVVPGLTDVDVLVVPLGIGSDRPLAEQYTTRTSGDVAQGFGTARRLFPVADTGLKYTETAGIVLPGTSPLCAGDTFWLNEMQPRLTAQRTTWNSSPLNRHMDRVLGAISPDRSTGPSTGTGGCADGYGQLATVPESPTVLGAAGPGIAAFARAVNATSQWGGPTVGSLIGMELAHTTGAVSARYAPNTGTGPVENGKVTNRFRGPHSAFTSGDPRGTRRAYDTHEQSLLTAPRSLMNFSGNGWNDRTTVLEKQDWDYLLCSVLPVPPGVDPRDIALLGALPQELTSCNDPGGFGFAAAAENGTYAISGSTDGTAAGTDAHSVDSAATTADRAVPGSPLRVVQRDANGDVIADDGIAVHMTSTQHIHGPRPGQPHEPTANSPRGVFGASVPARPGTRTLELYVGPPGGGNLPIYTRSVTVRPTFRTVEARGGSVSVTVDHPRPDKLRLDLFARCPGTGDLPLVVGARPVSTTPAAGPVPGTAAFATTYDGSLACAGATLVYRVTDGIQSQTGTGALVDGLRPAVAEISAPAAGKVVTSLANIGLEGRVVDAGGVEAARVSWVLSHTSPDGVVTTREVAARPLATAVPPPGGWKTGTTRLSLRGFDVNDRLIATTTRTFTIVLDSDADGFSDDLERGLSCLGEPAVLDDRTPHLDPDGDGLYGLDDGAPCASALTVDTKFTPTSLFKSANGQSVSFALSAPRGVDLATLKADELYVLQIGGASVARLTGSTTTLPASAMSLTGPTTATVKVDRERLVQLLGGRLGYTPIVLGTLDGRVRGLDPTAPHVFP